MKKPDTKAAMDEFIDALSAIKDPSTSDASKILKLTLAASNIPEPTKYIDWLEQEYYSSVVSALLPKIPIAETVRDDDGVWLLPESERDTHIEAEDDEEALKKRFNRSGITE